MLILVTTTVAKDVAVVTAQVEDGDKEKTEAHDNTTIIMGRKYIMMTHSITMLLKINNNRIITILAILMREIHHGDKLMTVERT